MRSIQKGMSTISALLLLAVAGVGLTALFKIGPHYLDNYFVKSSLTQLSEQEDWVGRTNSQLMSDLYKQFTVNNVRDIKREDVTFSRDDGRVTVSIAYERRGNFMGNLDYVVVFDNSIEASSSQ